MGVFLCTERIPAPLAVGTSSMLGARLGDLEYEGSTLPAGQGPQSHSGGAAFHIH